MARTKSPTSITRKNNKDLTENLELPEMKDIPGQEHIHRAGVPGEMADTTISSDDEEGVRDGKDLLSPEEDDDVKIVMGTEADVTNEDLVLLGDKDHDMDMDDDEMVLNAKLDDIDDEGDSLNEKGSGESGRDLDIPEAEEEDGSDRQDEENNYYSLGGDDQDDTDNGTPNEYRK
jgi:hypothetical protein